MEAPRHGKGVGVEEDGEDRVRGRDGRKERENRERSERGGEKPIMGHARVLAWENRSVATTLTGKVVGCD